MSLVNEDGVVGDIDGKGPIAVGRTGIQVKQLDDGSLAILNVRTKQALHCSPDQAQQLRQFVRMFDQTAEKRTVLTEARDIVYGDREKTHGEPGRNLEAIAAMWTPIFERGGKVTAGKVALAMIALKVARAIATPDHRDHWIDIVGYAAVAERAGLITPPK